ncbi:hypothetical protein EHM76_04330 [bacterium]|nr:MAG: hypothetical protein EHM76_04330 [bacterium]
MNRAEHFLEIRLGRVLVDKEGDDWVFVGWHRNTAGLTAVFVRKMNDKKVHRTGRINVWTYNASSLYALVNKFPELRREA